MATTKERVELQQRERSTILSLLCSDDPSALGELKSLLDEALATPNAMLVDNEVVETKTLKVPAKPQDAEKGRDVVFGGVWEIE